MQETGDPETPPLAAQVGKLERRVAKLDSLCGEIIACLSVNLQRGTLTSEDDEQLNMLIDSWNRQRQQT